MSFESVLQKIVDGCGDAIGVALMGNDGIPIVHVHVESRIEKQLGYALGAAGAEFGRILGDIHKASDSLGGGRIIEKENRLSRITLLFREIADDVVLVLAIGPTGNIGKSRFLMRRFEREIRDEL